MSELHVCKKSHIFGITIKTNFILKKLKMKKTQNILLTVALVMTGILVSCGPKEKGNPTLQQQIITAIDGKTYTLNVTGSSFGDAVVTAGTVSLTASSAGAGTYTVSSTGELGEFVSGGSFSITKDGKLSSVVVNAASADDVVFSGGSASLNSDQSELTIQFTGAESSRTDGIGSWKLIFKK